MKITDFINDHIKITFFICAAVLSIAIYAQTLKYDFTYLDDDILIIDKIDALSDVKAFPSYFYKSVFSFGADKYYRPALNASFAADAIAGGLNPSAYHWTDILLHIFAVFLIFVFLLKSGFNGKLCFALCSLFAAHPAFVQAVAWIPGRNDTLLGVFVAASMIFLTDYLNTRKNVYLFLHALFFLAALFAKETAAVLIAVIPCFVFLSGEQKFTKQEAAKLCFALFIASAVYFSLRYAALRNSRSEIDILVSLKYAFYSLPAIFQYCDYFINPSRLSLVPASINVDCFSIVSAFAVFAFPFVSSFIFNRGGKKIVLFGFLWFLSFLMPTLIIPNNNYFSHRLYLPAVGVIIMWVECLPFVLKEAGAQLKKALLFIFLSALILFACASFFHAKKFQDRRVFWLNALIDAPESSFVVSSTGLYYYDNKMYDEAEKYFLKAVSLNPSDYVSYNNLGSIYVFRGDAQKAAQYFERSLAANPDNDTAMYNLSQLFYVSGYIEQALELAEKALSLEPEGRGYKEYYEKIHDKKFKSK
ncbi:MAG: tetratricopeptide repeat protein [Endomicrobium sp.]|jgi:tetratricopeptide (TPR) repeat protein|nr:tetratricopeptide repeat protein [Endomicrobium sp.]